MQRFYSLLSVLMVCGALQLQAQTCLPDESLPDTVIIAPAPVTESNPDGGITDTACVNRSFGLTFTLRAPSEITVSGITGEIDSIVIDPEDALEGIPEGFDYTCGTDNCTFYPDSLGCIYLFGTPPSGSEGTYNLGISATVYAVVFGIPQSIPVTLPDENIAPGNYFLNVQPEGFANCAPVNVREHRNDVFSVAVAPNPAREVATIRINSKENLDGQLQLFNAAGQRVSSQPIRVSVGESFHQVDVRPLPAGFYTFTVGSGSRGVSGRLSVLR